MVDDKVKEVKLVGRREINMDKKLKAIFDEMDEYKIRPFYNDAQETFR